MRHLLWLCAERPFRRHHGRDSSPVHRIAVLCEGRDLDGVGAGQSVESLTSQTLRTDSRTLTSWTLFADLVMPVSEHWHLRFDLEREEVQGSVVRYGAGLGVGVRF